jgi:purine-binding chemotaxis protein CheW
MNTETETTRRNIQADDRTLQLVSFLLGGELYGVPITQVREIILVGTISRLPRAPNYLQGVINLRKNVIPVIDLRTLLGLPAPEISADSRILVVQVSHRLVGILVDAVCEVLRIQKQQISPPPTLMGFENQFLTGIAELDGRLLTLIDFQKILGETQTHAHLPTSVSSEPIEASVPEEVMSG